MPVAIKTVAIKRVYEPASRADGTRVLVDRLWPRGVAKATACIDEWLRDLAPSDELRRWFHDRLESWQGAGLANISQEISEGIVAATD
jgi:uncharacterized protein YeaO (DUF488 family)